MNTSATAMRAPRSTSTTAPLSRRARREERARRRATWRFFAGICAVGMVIVAFSVAITLAR
jgi:hypothetical protein